MKGFFITKELNNKNRIILPGFIEKNTKINFYHIYEDYLSLYTEEEFDKYLDHLYSMRDEMTLNGVDTNKIERRIFKLETDILGYSYVQSQNRIVLPSNIVDAFKMKKIVLVGSHDHIKLFPNEDAFNNFREKVKIK